jgi:hypothetical protein
MICGALLSKQLKSRLTSEFVTKRFPLQEKGHLSRALVVLLRKWTVWPCYDVALSRVTVGALCGRALTLYVVVHCELVGVGAETKSVVFLLFHVDPVGDEVFVEDITAQQEGVIGLECFNCTAK